MKQSSEMWCRVISYKYRNSSPNVQDTFLECGRQFETALKVVIITLRKWACVNVQIKVYR
jgi:hypothetical protein